MNQIPINDDYRTPLICCDALDGSRAAIRMIKTIIESGKTRGLVVDDIDTEIPGNELGNKFRVVYRKP